MANVGPQLRRRACLVAGTLEQLRGWSRTGSQSQTTCRRSVRPSPTSGSPWGLSSAYRPSPPCRPSPQPSSLQVASPAVNGPTTPTLARELRDLRPSAMQAWMRRLQGELAPRYVRVVRQRLIGAICSRGRRDDRAQPVPSWIGEGARRRSRQGRAMANRTSRGRGRRAARPVPRPRRRRRGMRAAPRRSVGSASAMSTSCATASTSSSRSSS
jgi:hypothetical protein